MRVVVPLESAWLGGRQVSVPRVVNLRATLRVTTPEATRLSVIALSAA